MTPSPPGVNDRHEVDVDGLFDEEKQVRYLGKATRQPDGLYHALACVEGALCTVAVRITEVPR